jgi:protein-disulfide isomerase
VRPDTEADQTLARPVEPARDHVLGDPDAPYMIVEYGDFQCGFCLKASGSILEVRNVLGDQLRYVWRHAPLVQYHPNVLAGAEASEAAAAQGKFFDFARAIFADQDNQLPSDIIRIARDLGLDVEQFEKDLISAEVTGPVRDDMLDAEAMNITAVPTLFTKRPPARRPVRRARAAASADGPDRHTPYPSPPPRPPTAAPARQARHTTDAHPGLLHTKTISQDDQA